VSIILHQPFPGECQRIADRCTVLRDGESVGTGEMAAARLNDLIRLMVGREIADIYPRVPHALGKPVLELHCLCGQKKPAR